MNNTPVRQHSGPPMIRRPHPAIVKRGTKQGLKRGYIYGVAPDNIRPTTCSVVIDNNPPLPGFSLPAGFGLILPYGTATYQGRPFSGPFLMNPTTLQGGTPVLVDSDTMAVVEILHSTSGSDSNYTNSPRGYVPSKAETLVGTHAHTGGTDSDGHLMPPTIGVTQLSPVNATWLTNGPSITACTVVRSQTTGIDQPLAISFTEIDFSTTVPDGLAAIEIVTRPHGTTNEDHAKTLDPSSATTGLYTASIAGFAGTPHDVGFRYIGFNGQKSVITWPSGGSNIVDPEGALLSATDGTMTYARHNSAVRSAIDSSSNLLSNPFGNASGVLINAADFSMSGFASTGLGSATQVTYPTSNALATYADIQSATNTGPVMVSIGDTNNGYSLQVSKTVINLYRYVGGVQSTVATSSGSLGNLNTQYVRLRLAVDFISSSVEAVVDCAGFGGQPAWIYPAQVDGSGPWTNFQTSGTVTVSVNASGSAGKVQNFAVNPRDLFLRASYPIYNAINPNFLVSGHALNPNVVDSQSIASNAVTSSKIDWGTGAIQVDLDSVPDGTTNGRVRLQNLTGGNMNTQFSNSGLYFGADGSIAGFPNNTLVQTDVAYPIASGLTLTSSGWVQAASTSNSLFFLIGDMNNGIGLRWNSSNVVAALLFKGGATTVLSTMATITRDTNYHWVSVKLTPGSTPGSSDVYSIYFDGNNAAGTTGASAITWGSTALVSYNPGGGSSTFGALLNFRVGSSNP